LATAKRGKKKTKTRKKVAPAPPAAVSSPGAKLIVSRQLLAELVGQHPDTITDYAREGMPVLTRGGQGKLGEYDAVACLDWWRQRIGKNAKEIAQTRALNASAEINELKRSQLIGELVDRDEAIRAGQMYVAAWKAMVLGLAKRMAQEGVIDSADQAAVDTLCRGILQEIASWKCVKDLESVEGFDEQFELEAVPA
jgi:phage terminase Nu1 subunit (DNA packaging protein)